MAQAVVVKGPLAPDELLFKSMKAEEELGRLFQYTVELVSLDGSIKLEDILGQDLTLAIEFPDGRKRFFHGFVTQFRQLARSEGKYFVYEAILRPKLWFLTRTFDCQIFQELSVPEILKSVMDGHGLTDVKKSLSGTYAKHDYIVQYGESDFDFVSRLMEDEGIYYYFEHSDGKHVLVLADSISAHAKIDEPTKVPYMLRRSGYAVDHVFDWQVSQQVKSVTYVHTDFDFIKPKANLETKGQIKRKHASATGEVFNFPGSYTETAGGEGLARTRIEELQSQYETIHGNTNANRFAAGKLFVLSEFHREDQNREYLLIASRYELAVELDSSATNSDIPLQWQCEFEAIPSTETYRTPSTTPKPVMKGPHTAIVVGKSGEEIWTDQYGRIKVQFHWDRYGKKDENSSCWLRVGQVWAGKTWGAIHIPRIGQEVIVDFIDGDPDRPIVTGRVYNGDNTTPYGLPDNQTQSGLKSRSSKEGAAENFNELRFEDLKGSEQIYFHAEKNFDRVVENNDTLKVGFDKKDPGDQTIDIYNHRTVTIDQGNEKLQVKTGNRETLVDTGDDTQTVKTGNRVRNIDTGNDTLTVKTGDRARNVDTGNDTLTVKTGNHTTKLDTGKILLDAAQEIELVVGGSSIKITPSSIELSSVNITITASGKAELKGAMTNVEGSATVTIKGGVVKIN